MEEGGQRDQKERKEKREGEREGRREGGREGRREEGREGEESTIPCHNYNHHDGSLLLTEYSTRWPL